MLQVQPPGHPQTKNLRRDQLVDRYDESIRTLQGLIKAKENEIAYRRSLVDMMEKSKIVYDSRLMKARQTYINLKKQVPDIIDLKNVFGSTSQNNDHPLRSTTPPIPPNMLTDHLHKPPTSAAAATSSTITTTPSTPSNTPSMAPGLLNNLNNNFPAPQQSTSSQKASLMNDSELGAFSQPADTNSSQETRSSLDRRLSEFLKTFPNLTQAGMASPQNSNPNIKPMPGYYTQHQTPPPPPAAPLVAATPPIMAMMRFPPPNLIQPPTTHQPLGNVGRDNNYDMSTDMDLSDHEEAQGSSTTSNATSGSLIPMVASAMQQGAGGKQHPAPQVSPYASGYNNPVQYAPRMNPLPFDPSIMDSRSSSSSSSRDKSSSHNDAGRGSRYSGGSSSSQGSLKHGSDKKYNSSSNRSKRR